MAQALHADFEDNLPGVIYRHSAGNRPVETLWPFHDQCLIMINETWIHVEIYETLAALLLLFFWTKKSGPSGAFNQAL